MYALLRNTNKRMLPQSIRPLPHPSLTEQGAAASCARAAAGRIFTAKTIPSAPVSAVRFRFFAKPPPTFCDPPSKTALFRIYRFTIYRLIVQKYACFSIFSRYFLGNSSGGAKKPFPTLFPWVFLLFPPCFMV
ncbi:MAG: hypothetical protein IJO10_03555 [Clostridia bacterium]|nr:hypothetical protein [Clostridia bacterium]